MCSMSDRGEGLTGTEFTTSIEGDFDRRTHYPTFPCASTNWRSIVTVKAGMCYIGGQSFRGGGGGGGEQTPGGENPKVFYKEKGEKKEYMNKKKPMRK